MQARAPVDFLYKSQTNDRKHQQLSTWLLGTGYLREPEAHWSYWMTGQQASLRPLSQCWVIKDAFYSTGLVLHRYRGPNSLLQLEGDCIPWLSHLPSWILIFLLKRFDSRLQKSGVYKFHRAGIGTGSGTQVLSRPNFFYFLDKCFEMYRRDLFRMLRTPKFLCGCQHCC